VITARTAGGAEPVELVRAGSADLAVMVRFSGGETLTLLDWVPGRPAIVGGDVLMPTELARLVVTVRRQ
jgi:hypothetical protein